VLPIDGTVQRYTFVEGGLAWRRADERLEPVPWFTPQRLGSSLDVVVFLPGPSPFLAGAKRLRPGLEVQRL
jgi:hypothetical protein